MAPVRPLPSSRPRVYARLTSRLPVQLGYQIVMRGSAGRKSRRAARLFLGYSRRRDNRPPTSPGCSLMTATRVNSPGQLLDGTVAPVQAEDEIGQRDESLAALAAQYGLTPSAQRAP